MTSTLVTQYRGSQEQAHGLQIAATCGCICPHCRNTNPATARLTVLGIHPDGTVRMLHHTRPQSLTRGTLLPRTTWQRYDMRVTSPTAQATTLLPVLNAAFTLLHDEEFTATLAPSKGPTPQTWSLTTRFRAPHNASQALTEFHLLAADSALNVTIVPMPSPAPEHHTRVLSQAAS